MVLNGLKCGSSHSSLATLVENVAIVGFGDEGRWLQPMRQFPFQRVEVVEKLPIVGGDTEVIQMLYRTPPNAHQ